MPSRTLIALVGLVLALVVGCTLPNEEQPTSTSNATEGKAKGSTTTTKSAFLPIACGEVSEAGRCASASTLEVCVRPSESTARTLVRRACGAGEECAVTEGRASCRPIEGRCTPGAERCADSGTVQRCDEDGKWGAPQACAQCTNTDGVGVTCPGTLPPSATTKKRGSLDFEFHGPNAAFTAFDETGVNLAAPRVLIASFVGNVPIDGTVTGDDGSFELAVPTTPSPSDRIVAFAARLGVQGKPLYGVGLPDIADGTAQVGAQIPPANERSGMWRYSWSLEALAGSLALHVSEAEGAGALNIFEMTRLSMEAAASIVGPPAGSLIVWMRPRSSWDCGACFMPLAETFGGARWDVQMFIGGDTTERMYWTDAVIAHEAGHALMSLYGFLPIEAGAHEHGCASPPSMAWSEGWATAFSSLLRSDPVMFQTTKDGRGSFTDIARRTYSNAMAWPLPTRAGGVLQPVNEDEVAAALWALANHPPGQNALLASPELFRALVSKRMTTAPFARGYTAKTTTGTCEEMTAVETGTPSPMFADYLDALRCDGFDPQRIAAAIGDYPYPVDVPALCN